MGQKSRSQISNYESINILRANMNGCIWVYLCIVVDLLGFGWIIQDKNLHLDTCLSYY